MEITSELQVPAYHGLVRPNQKHVVIRTEHCTLGPVVFVDLVALLDLLINYDVLSNSTAFPETNLSLVVFIMTFIISSSSVCFYIGVRGFLSLQIKS